MDCGQDRDLQACDLCTDAAPIGISRITVHDVLYKPYQYQVYCMHPEIMTLNQARQPPPQNDDARQQESFLVSKFPNIFLTNEI